ncbi:MAG: YadA C-terminal domain-containing protein [Deltaproteobacteria bacterium]|nr:YadA C-terminal domain-containing protein [Deltaproteobacteria bacterium]
MVVQESRTTLSGGNASTSLTLHDYGATFSNSATGQPVQVHGVDDGTHDFDAVNFRQLQKAFAGVASVAALTAIPEAASGNRFSVGIGYGRFEEVDAMAIGVKAAITKNISAKAGLGYSNNVSTVSAGIGYSW